MLRFFVMTFILGGLLFLPASKLIWILSVRRLERLRGGPLSDLERRGQLRRSYFLSFFIVLVFSSFFQYSVFGIY